MALFRRNKTDQAGMPPEVQSYYQTEKRERAGVAWLLGLATLLITTTVVLGLFFGGRWTFRKLKNNHKPTVATTQTETKKPDTPATSSTPSTPQTSSTSTTTPSSTATSQTSSSSAPATSATPAYTSPSASPAGKGNLPSTGPGDMLAVFVITSIIGTLFYERVLRTRGSNS